MKNVKNIVFDLGGVLIKWDPRNLYCKLFETSKEIDHFLENVCTSDWNEKQDAGRKLSEAPKELIEQFPHLEKYIKAYYDRWPEMLGGVYNKTQEILYSLKQKNEYKIYALSNWSKETFPIAQARYKILHEFDGIVLSGEEGLIKPDSAFDHILLYRYDLKAKEC